MFRNVAKLLVAALQLGLKTVLCHPVNSHCWRDIDANVQYSLEVAKLQCHHDTCEDGSLNSSQTIRIQTNAEEVKRNLQLQCPGTHKTNSRQLNIDHSNIPIPMCETLSTIVLQKKRTQTERIHNVCTNLDNSYLCMACGDDNIEEFSYPTALLDPVSERMAYDPEGTHHDQVIRHLRMVHHNLGHPSSRLLAKVLKEAGADDNVIKAALEL